MTTETPVSQTNPLSEAKVESLNELFARDPLGYTKQDLTRIVEFLRKGREAWVEDEKKGKTRGRKSELQGASATSDAPKLSAADMLAKLNLLPVKKEG